MAERSWNFSEETYAAAVTSVVAFTLILLHGAPPHWHTELISVSRLWKIVSHLLSKISFHCTTYIHFKFHIMDSCCLRYKFHLAATSIAVFISDVTDFILASRVTFMADFILLTPLVSYIAQATFTTKIIPQISFHYTSYFHQRYHFSSFHYRCWLDHISFSGYFHCRFHFVCYIIHRLHFTC